jgi:hypothetical protein
MTEKRTMTLDQMSRLYLATEKPDDVSDEFWELCTAPEARMFMAAQMGVSYESHLDMVNRLSETEMAADPLTPTRG